MRDTASLIARAVRARDVAGDLHRAQAAFDAAYHAGELGADASTMAAAVLGMGGVWVHQHRTAAANGLLRARLQHVLSLVDPDSAFALRIRTRLAAEDDYRTGRHDRVLAALEQTRASGDPVARAEALSLAHHCLLGPDHGTQRRLLADQMIGEAARSGRRLDLLVGLLWRTVDQFLDADPHAERGLTELRGVLGQSEHLAVGFVVRSIDVMLAIRGGRFDDAEMLAKECAERGAEAGDIDAVGWYGAQLVAIRWYQGRLGELLPMLTELVHSPTLSPVDNSYFAALATAAAMSGDRLTAERALATLRGRGLTELPRSSSWLVTMYGVVEAANFLENEAASARAYHLLRPFAHLPMLASLGVACFGSVHHALGVASLTQRHIDGAVNHFREAAHLNVALGHWPAVISSRQRLAEALIERARPEDLAEAHRQREQVEELTSMLGIRIDPATITRRGTPTVRCARQGRGWRIELGARSVVVDHAVGMLHLAVLTANAGAEIAAIDLVTGVDGIGRAAGAGTTSEQALLDRNAIQSYRRRLAELAEAIDDADSTDEAERARSEREWLLAEISGATALGGRARTFADDTEKARLAVGKAIRRTIAHIEAADTAIGRHLRASVHTGVRCWYRPAG
jgi:hypothetical protein